MSFGFRDKDRPSLRDRLRGKSGDQILEELRRKLDKDKEMFFERTPNPPSFRRAGFPFDDGGLAAARGRPDFRHRLEELAQQHPEFADSLRPWYEEQHGDGDMGWGFRKRTASNSSQPQQAEQSDHQQGQQAQQQAQQCEQAAEQRPGAGIAHHGLRNTVDLGEAQAAAQANQMESQEERNQRAQSAPPAPDQQAGGQQQQRFVSRLDINPQPAAPSAAPNAAPGAGPSQDPAAARPPPGPAPAPKPAPSNVRQIPIFVEGRDEPVVPKFDLDTHNFGQGLRDHQFAHHGPSYGSFARPPSSRFGDGPRHFPFHSRDYHDYEAPAHKRPFPQQHHHQPPAPPARQPSPQAHPQHHPQAQPQQQPPRQQTPPQQQQREQTPPREQTKPKDALEKVKDVQVEVEALAKQVDEFKGTRQDKQYLFLDEMLTRELIKLDVIETEGRDDVRAARKETIRAIQQCIAKLEAAAGTGSAEGAELSPANTAAGEAVEAMEVEQSSQQPEESSEMNVDCKTEGQEAPASDPTPAPATPSGEPAAPEKPSAEPAVAPSPAPAEAAPSQEPAGSSTDSKPQAMDTGAPTPTPAAPDSAPVSS